MTGRKVSLLDILVSLTAWAAIVCGYALFGLEAIGVIVQGFLWYAFLRISWLIFWEHRAALLYEIRRNRALDQWGSRRKHRRLS